MQSQITARKVDLNTELREHISKRLDKLQRVYDGIVSVHIILSENNAPSKDKTAEINVDVYQKRLSAEGEGSTHEEAINECADALWRQLKRYKAKLHSTDKDAHR